MPSPEINHNHDLPSIVTPSTTELRAEQVDMTAADEAWLTKHFLSVADAKNKIDRLDTAGRYQVGKAVAACNEKIRYINAIIDNPKVHETPVDIPTLQR